MPDIAIPTTCNKDCGGGCPLTAHVKGGRIVRIGSSRLGGPAMTGCIRGYEMARVVYASDRPLRPLLRTGPRGSGQFREIGWPEALDRLADALLTVRERYGAASILALAGFGSGRGALHSTQRLGRRFLALFGGYTAVTGGYSSAAADYVTPLVLGTDMSGIDSATLRHTKLILLWGANPFDTRLGCDTNYYISEARARGVPVVVIDPRRSASAQQQGTRWIPVRPGTDAALMMAVLFVLLRDGLLDRPFIESHSAGFDLLERDLRGESDGQAKSPEWAESICGVPPAVTEDLAHLYGATRPAALIPGLSIQRTVGGEEAIRLAIALQVATGNLGRMGGSSGGLTWGKLPGARAGRIEAPPNPVPSGVPVVRWPDAILEGRAGGYPADLRAVYNLGSNYLMQGSDLHKSIRAFEKVDLAVCHDYTLTPTARYCDLVLPSTTFLEREDLVFPGGGNYLLYANRVIPPRGEAWNDYRIFCELAERLGFGPAFSEGRSEADWLAAFLQDSDVDDIEEFKRTGVWWGADRERVALGDFSCDPVGHPLATPSGRVEIASPAYAGAGFPTAPACRPMAREERHPLYLVTPHARFRTHSQYDNIAWFREKEPQSLWMHPLDAAARGVGRGDAVWVYNDRGRTRVPVLLTDGIMPGVVGLLEGVWPELDQEGCDRAGSANVLTTTEPTLPSQATRTHSVWVEVERAP